MKYIKHISLLIITLAALMIVSMTFATQCNANQSPEVITKIITIEVAPKPVYNVTSMEREMLARLVYREANTESIECQQAVASVVINRWLSGYWGNTLEDVVYAPYQFSPSNLLYCTTPTETNYEAVDYVLENGVTIPEYVMYFRLDFHFNWKGYKAYQKIDNTCFGYMEKDMK